MKRGHRVLEDHRDLLTADPPEFPIRQPEEVAAAEQGPALDDRPWRKEPEERQHRHCLAAAALAGDAEDLLLFDAVVDAVDDGDEPRSGRKPHAKPVDVEERLGHSLSAFQAVCGSKKSRRLSPRKLNASTAEKSARPGNVPIHQNWK